MDRPAAKKFKRQTGVFVEDLRAKLLEVDDSSLSEFLAFKRHVLCRLPPPLTTAIASTSTNIPTLAAAKLTRREVFSYFGLSNKCSEKWGSVVFDIPKFELHPEFDTAPAGPSEWLSNALDRCTAVFSRNNESDIRIFINLIIMDVVHEVQNFQSSDVFKPTDRPSTPPPPPVGLPHPIQTFSEVHISSTVRVDDHPLRITGRFDLGFGHQPSDSTSDPSLLLETYLAVMETKGTHCDLEGAFDQLLVYLAIVHRARARKLRRENTVDGNSTVYGVLSDGTRFLFLCLDNDSHVHRSPEFNIVMHFPQILRYFRHCLAVVSTSSPTSSPLNIRMERRPGPPVQPVPYKQLHDDEGEDDEEADGEYDFVGLQKRVFQFRTAEFDEEDLVRLE